MITLKGRKKKNGGFTKGNGRQKSEVGGRCSNKTGYKEGMGCSSNDTLSDNRQDYPNQALLCVGV
jgi:hypothetical protein